MAEDSGGGSGWEGAAIIGGASLLGSMLGSDKQGKYNAKEAEKNRVWQERMSSTAYRRAADDLEAAGLNRILAFGNPATTPSGGQASIEAPKFGESVNTGIAAASAKQSIAQSQAQTEVLQADEKLRREQTNTQIMDQHLKKEQMIQAQTQSDYNSAAAAKANAEAIKVGMWNPVQKLGNDILEKLTNFARGSAKQYNDSANAVQIRKNSQEKMKPIQRNFRKPQ